MHSPRWKQHSTVSNELDEKWRAIWRKNPNATPNSNPEQFLEISEALGVEPTILEVMYGDTLELLILCRIGREASSRRVGYLQFPFPRLHSLKIVYGGILGSADFQSTASAVLRDLLSTKVIEHISINRTTMGGRLHETICKIARTVERKGGLHWKLRLSDSFENVMARHSSKHRKRLRWEYRKLLDVCDDALTYETFEEASKLNRVLTLADSISQRTYHVEVGGSVEDSAIWRAQLKHAAGNREMRAHFMYDNGKPIAFVIGVNSKSSVHILAMAYLPNYAQYSPGKHLLLYAIERACADGLSWVDYGFGDAEYKRVYGSDCTEEVKLEIYGTSAKATIAWLIDLVSVWTELTLRRIVGSSASRALKRAWRQRLTRRIR